MTEKLSEAATEFVFAYLASRQSPVTSENMTEHFEMVFMAGYLTHVHGARWELPMRLLWLRRMFRDLWGFGL